MTVLAEAARCALLLPVQICTKINKFRTGANKENFPQIILTAITLVRNTDVGAQNEDEAEVEAAADVDMAYADCGRTIGAYGIANALAYGEIPLFSSDWRG